MLRPVVFLKSLGAWAIRALVLSGSELLFENLALRHQVCALKRERPRRLIIVEPDTVAKWHRERFRRHWAKLSQRNRRPGRPLESIRRFDVSFA